MVVVWLPKKGVTFDLRGLKDVQNGFNKALKNITHFTTEATMDNVLLLAGDAVKQAPVETGALRRSCIGEVNGVGICVGNDDGSITKKGTPHDMNVSFGRVSFAEIYAATQHEMTSYNHPKGGKAKFLEDPFKDNFNRMMQHYKDAVRDGCGN